MGNEPTALLCAQIYNCAWWIRHYSRPAGKVQRRAAILALGLQVRTSFAESDDFEPLLRALADSLAGAWPPAA
jgi:hypothetical protein